MGNSNHTNLFDGMLRCLVRFSLCLLFFLPLGASAIDWRNDYTLALTMERDDNFRLTEIDPIETSILGLFGSAEIRGEMELSNFQLGILANTRDYSESSIEDSELYSIFFKTQRRGERWLGSLDMSFTVEPTTETELGDTGARIDGQRESASIAPNIRYQVSERDSIYLNFVLRDVSYDTVSLVGYTDNAISTGWITQVSETSDISINATVSEYEPENNASTTVTSLDFGYGYNSSEATRYDLRLGYANAEAPEGSSADGISSFEVRHTLDERNSFTLLASNGFVGSGAGSVRYESRLNLGWDHALSDRMGFILDVEGIKSDFRDYAEILGGVSYRYNREFSINANYRFRQQHSDTIDADSNSILFSLRYSPVSGFRHTL